MQCSLGLFAVIEVMFDRTDDLIVLVTFAGEQHQIIGTGSKDRTLDRLSTIGLDQVATLSR